MGNTSTTSPVWEIDKNDKAKWLKRHKRDTVLVEKFNKFEASVTDNPYPASSKGNPKVKRLKGNQGDVLEYKAPPVRGLYMLDEPASIISLVDFNRKGQIDYD